MQAAHSDAALVGQVTVTVVALRRNSMRMSCGGAGVGAGKIIGANEGFEGVVTEVGVAAGTAAIRAAGFISALRSQ